MIKKLKEREIFWLESIVVAIIFTGLIIIGYQLLIDKLVDRIEEVFYSIEDDNATNNTDKE
jgi:FtsH-binding integral membrane protein